MAEICTDNRFEIIEYFKQEIIKFTNIETCPEEMAQLDSILFRMWQFGWLDILYRHKEEIKKINIIINALDDALKVDELDTDPEEAEMTKEMLKWLVVIKRELSK